MTIVMKSIRLPSEDRHGNFRLLCRLLCRFPSFTFDSEALDTATYQTKLQPHAGILAAAAAADYGCRRGESCASWKRRG